MAVEKVINIRDHEKRRDPDAVDRDPAERDAIIIQFPPTCDNMRPRMHTLAKNSAWLVGFLIFVSFMMIDAALAQYGQRGAPLGFCTSPSLSSAQKLTAFTCASFTGTASATVLTASSVSGQIRPGQTVAGSGVTAGTTIVSQVTPLGPLEVIGGAGRYNLSLTSTASTASLTTGGAPAEADYAVFCVATQSVNYRDDGTAPTATAGSGGLPIPSGACMGYSGTFSALQFIQQTSTAVMGVAFYSSRTQ